MTDTEFTGDEAAIETETLPLDAWHRAKGGRMVGRWPGLANTALEEGADLAVETDYRDVLAELLAGHLRLSDPGAVFPGLVPRPTGLWG